MPQDLSDFEQLTLTFENETRHVFRKGEGPAVIVMHEIPGIHPGVIRLANALCATGVSVWVPSLIGTPGKQVNGFYIASSLIKACIAQEFTVFATSVNSQITSWLRCLAKYAHKECGGPGVGAIGMCLTGSFALAMMVEDAVLAPVLCNPSLPFAITPSRKCDLGVDKDTLARVKKRCVAEDICILGLRFSEDIAVPSERFQRLRDEFGSNFLSIEIDSSPGNMHGLNRLAHSVLGVHYVDEPKHPTVLAELQAVSFICDRLKNVHLS